MAIMQTVAAWFGYAPRDPVDGNQNATRTVTKTAKPVTFDSAMTVTAVFASIRLLAETIASMPIEMYVKDKNGLLDSKANHDIIKLLRYKPNKRQNRIEFMEQLMLNLVSDGNAYTRITRVGDKNSRIISLDIINSSNMTVILKNDDVIYRQQITSAVTRDFKEEDIWHVKLFGNGIKGLSPLQHAAKAVGVADASDDKITSLMKNGAKPTGALMTKGSPNADQRDALRKEMGDLTSGDETFMPVLPLDMKFQAISLTPSDIELLATRRFSLEEIARMFGVPSILINDSTQSTNWGSGIASIIEAFHKFNLRPYLERLELSMLTSLVPRKDWDKYQFEIDADAILRSSRKERVEMYNTEISTGQRTPNEIRRAEGWKEKDGGDELYMQLGFAPMKAIAKQQPNQQKVTRDE
ncbi:phage portal protein, HK97 family [Psychrobacter pacificensis]|uniref:Portal protein n=1 Tax=Psychrobacter pacificensis TaxID=112002 RepID=A0A1G7AW78_9GAMM|nr:phage portal protein [Psychrobacter pacificensis]GLR28998.1 portal protein [Psychrobacter pacificensis]SDE18255.1 phage portal protein, HK97 family [Psychrobacter pacificensis]